MYNVPSLIIEAYKCIPSSTKPAWLQAYRRQTNVISFGCTPFSHICSRVSLPCPCIEHPPSMVFQVTTYILRWHLDENSPTSSMFPHFAYMSTKLPHTKTSDSKPILNDPVMNTPALFKCNQVGTCIEHPHKSYRVWLYTFLLHICWNSSKAFCPCLHFTCPNITTFQVTTSQDGIFLNTVQASSMLPHFVYMSNKILHTKTSYSQPFWMCCSWTSLPCTCAPKLTHALITWIEMNFSGVILSCCICQKSYITFLGCRSLTYFVSFLLQGKMCNCTVPGAIVAISTATHGGFCQFSSQSASPVFLCVKSKYLSFVYSQDPGQANQPCILHIPSIMLS